VLKEDLKHHSPSIIDEDSSKDPKSLFDTIDFASISVDELWKLRETVETIVAQKISAEIVVLRRYLERLSPETNVGSRRPLKAGDTMRRPYPSVVPKYRNPTEPSQTWAGRGRTPRWVKLQLSMGKRLEDLKIG
jgi:DNA-binding protein H-NS